jgi:hypothetical protein
MKGQEGGQEKETNKKKEKNMNGFTPLDSEGADSDFL